MKFIVLFFVVITHSFAQTHFGVDQKGQRCELQVIADKLNDTEMSKRCRSQSNESMLLKNVRMRCQERNTKVDVSFEISKGFFGSEQVQLNGVLVKSISSDLHSAYEILRSNSARSSAESTVTVFFEPYAYDHLGRPESFRVDFANGRGPVYCRL